MATHSSTLAWRILWMEDPGGLLFMGSHRVRFPGEGNGNPLQYYCLENPMDRGAWQATVHGVTKSWTRLSEFTFTLTFTESDTTEATQHSIARMKVEIAGQSSGQDSALPLPGSRFHPWLGGGMKVGNCKSEIRPYPLPTNHSLSSSIRFQEISSPKGVGSSLIENFS